MTFFSAGTNGNNFTALAWNNNNLFFQNYTSGSQVTATSTAVFRDPSAWYHVVLAIDTTQATAADRAKIYVNGVQQAGFSGSSFSLNQQFWINFTYRHTLSARSLSSIDSYTGQYMAEINFVDGQALTPSSFGATDKDGNWSPISYTGTYGQNGFYIKGDATSTSAGAITTTSSTWDQYLKRSDNATGWASSSITIEKYPYSYSFNASNFQAGSWGADFSFTLPNEPNPNATPAYIQFNFTDGTQRMFFGTGGNIPSVNAFTAGQATASNGRLVWDPVARTLSENTSSYGGSVSVNSTYTGKILLSIGVYGGFSGGSGTLGYTSLYQNNRFIFGTDYSGNQNNFTPYNLDLNSGPTYDSMIDVPEDQSDGTANNRGNYCTLNPLTFWNSIGGGSLTNGNLTLTADSGNNRDTRAWGTMGVSTGKWYFESTINTVDSTYMSIGVSNYILGANTGFSYGSQWIYHSDGNKVNSANPADTGTSYGNTYTTNDIIGVAVDMDNGKIWFSKNGTWQASGDPVAGTNAAYTNLTSTTVYPFTYQWTAGSQQSPNFGQRPFTYTPPTGFKTLNTFNLPEPTIKQPNKHFDVTSYTGTGSSRSITGFNFAPDFVWMKSRSYSYGNGLFDTLRGVTRSLQSQDTALEETRANDLTAFNSDGFTVGNGTNVNLNSSNTYTAFAWSAGGANTTNTNGSVTSIVRANPTAGFSIVSWTGTGSVVTVGHGLNAVPRMIIVKRRSGSGTSNWSTYHASIGNTGGLNFNTTDTTVTNSGFWNNTDPTSSVFTMGTYESNNGAAFIAYCFADIPGYSAYGSYVGNGSADGPFIYTGFRPAWIITKSTTLATGASVWVVADNRRLGYNADNATINANETAVENNSQRLDILSNGFKQRTSPTSSNGVGQTYIWFAIAEMPFKYSRAR
jgi:hypothetical protein